MAIFNITDLNALTQMKDLFPEFTEKQFQVTLEWALAGISLPSLAAHHQCSVQAVKQILQRSKERMELDSIEMLRGAVLLRAVVGLWKR